MVHKFIRAYIEEVKAHKFAMIWGPFWMCMAATLSFGIDTISSVVLFGRLGVYILILGEVIVANLPLIIYAWTNQS